MRSRIDLLLVAIIAVAGCTATPRVSTIESGSPSGTGPGAPSLVPVKGYAQEFCTDGTSANCPRGAVPDALRRPLQIPAIAAGAPCPRSRANPRIWSRRAPGLGPGPVGPVGLGSRAILRFRRLNGAWGLQKVLWVATPAYEGPILIRGVRLDGDGAVGFSFDNGPRLAELQLPPGPTLNTDERGSRTWPSFTRVQTPGCYSYQVDGTDFSYAIVFRALRSRDGN
jgi:hypothetical protein